MPKPGLPFPGMGAPLQGSGCPPQGAIPPVMQQPTPPQDYSHDPYVDMAPKAISRTPIIVVIGLLAIGGLFFGTNSGKAWSDRVQLNVSLRDCLIVQYEIDKAVKLFDELDVVINAAMLRAGKQEYDPKHIEFLTNNIKENPIKTQIFTERSYKSFGRQAMDMLSRYYIRWSALYQMTSMHRQKTLADEEALKAYKSKFQKIFSATYGVAFKREGSKLWANVAYLGAPEKKGKGNQTRFPVKASPDGAGELRELYNPPVEGSETTFAKSPEKVVVAVSPDAKNGLLAGAVNSQFNTYIRRLDEIRNQMRLMRDEQTGLVRKLAILASQDPAFLASPNPEEEFEAYVAQNQKAQ